MNTPYRCPPKLARVAFSVAGALGATSSLDAATLSIATEPLGTATTSIKPNVMFILDDSGSMSRDFMPEYVVESHNPTVGSTAGCFDSGDDDSGSITGRPDACTVGDPPYMSPDFNTIYYNPAIYYRPAMNYNGNERTNQNAANTTNWTVVRTDDYNRDNVDQLGNATTTVNLATNYPDRVWCISTSDASGSGNCRQNGAYLYPNYQFRRGETDSGNVKYIGTAPYYYRAQTAQYCRVDGTDCRSGNQINPTLHKLQAPEFCLDSELTNCAVGAAVTTLHVFSGIRWCNNPELQEDPVTNNPRLRYCQRKKIGNFIYAKHLGTTVNQTGTFPAVPNEGQITVTRVAAGGGTINSITIGGTTVASGVSIPAGSTTTAAAALIASAINAHASFDATFSGANVIITQATAGSTGAGANIQVSSSGTPTQQARGTLTLSTVSNNVVRTISSLTVGGTQLLCGISSTQSFSNSVSALAPSGNIVASSGWNQSVEISSVMRAITDRINACTGVNGGYTATKLSGSSVEIRAPLSAGSTVNGQSMAISVTNGFGLDVMEGGADSPDIGVATSAMAGGADAFSGTRAVRIGVGRFTRTDIVPTVDSYPKAPTRSDCLGGASCTYVEEMTNFANWYAFYRTRMNMMKTAAGRAFVTIDDTYRVGFITINPGSPVGVNEYLRISDFSPGVGGHKQAWYSKFYFQTAGGGTPLRQALSRVGWMFGGQLDTDLTLGIPAADDPMTASCQPNFAILSTDGYWNGAGGKELDGADMGNHDNTNSGYATRSSGAYDGNLLPTTSAGTSAGGRNTLADVAMYYYKTDLRTSGAYATDNVPITNKDTNPTQHMVTFTLGLGLDGELTYRPDYETAATGDFAQIKQGTKNWPSPKADAPTALDDLWHAAVNGRGVFFSARDPQTLSTALVDTLSNLQTRIGAGAAAATSNLQPVAGDNFAFTAQYQTADWIGDLKARTIDLSSGIVSSITLWSAASLLDLMAHTDRNLFTFDASDSAGNRMKHMCWPSAGGATCTDGSGLTAAEQAYFLPTLLLQYPFSGDAGKLATASSEKVLNFLRGDRTYEDAGAGDPTDLFRLRDSLLGDIINAQPSYVKGSPFSYGDNGYDAFKRCTQGLGSGCPAAQFPDPSRPRPGTVYAAANDGFLHAFETDVNNNPYYQTAGIGTALTADDTFSCSASVCNVGNGVERWAYMPGLILPSAIRLANKPYSHRYFTDGSPVAADICLSTPCGGINDWRTILVAGLNSGGVGYYALDVTNPLPSGVKVLWEFTNKGKCWTDAEIEASPQDKTDDCHLGLSYGNPIVTKRKSDGKWVVIVSSGYNNTVGGSPGTDTGDGKGYIYILEAHTGIILKRLTTNVGDAATPSGLAKINGFATDSVTDNTVLAVYGGDLEGNLWRFDLDSAGANYLRVVPVAVAKDSGGVAQPITVKPELGLIPSAADARVILFGTGKFLENTDKSDTSAQTIYALKDVPATGTGPIISDVRNTTLVKPRSFAGYAPTDTTRTVAAGAAPSWTTEFGWLLDLPESGERVNVDPQLQLGTLIVSSNVPSGDSCTAGGSSWLNFLDYLTGSYVQGASGQMASTKFGSSLAVGINVIMLPGGKVVTIVTTADNQQLTKDTPVPATAFAGRRVSWRELVKE